MVNQKKQIKFFLENCICPEFGLYALLKDKLVGFVGINGNKFSFLDCSFRKMINVFGIFGSIKLFFHFAINVGVSKIKKNELKIDMIAVDPTCHGMGIGKKMLNTFFNYANKNNIKRIYLEVVDTNQRAHELYKKLNFKMIETYSLKNSFSKAGFSKSHLMCKQLQPCDTPF